MKRAILTALTLVALLGLPSPQPASADPPPTGAPIQDPNPRPLTAAERDAFMTKQAAFERSKADLANRRSAQGADRIESSGSVWTDIFEEPQSEPGSYNWCGPGSTTAVLTNWNSIPYNYNGTYGSGPIPYMKQLALDGVGGIGPMVQYVNGQPVTTDVRLRDTINNQTSSLFYVIQNPVGGASNFVAYLNSDINGLETGYGHPLFTVVWTAGMPGWGTWTTKHWQWVVAFDDGANFIQFGDSAGPNACQPSCLPDGPYGWHTSMTLTNYYTHIADPNVYDEIVW